MSSDRINGLSRRSFLNGIAKSGALTQIGTLSSLAPAAFALPAPKATPTAPAPALRLNAHDFGTTGDGLTLETAALQRALDRCNVLGGGEVLVPAGRYLTGGLSLRSNVILHLEKDTVLLGSPDLSHYPVAEVRWEGKWIPGYTALIHALDAQNFAVLGEGRIEGNIAVAGRPTKDNPLRRPALIEFINCRDIHLEGFSTSYAHMWSIHPTCCDNLIIRNLNIRSTMTNGDGIDIDSCRHIVIDSCDIASGDDCISLKSGRGEEANTMARPTEDVHITSCTLEGRGYACLGIGTESSGGIRNVLVENCRITSVYKFGIYIKSRVGRGAFIEDFTVRNMDAANMRMGFLRIAQTDAGVQDADPVPGLKGVPLFRNLRFEDIRVQDAPILVDAVAIHPEKMLDGLVLEKISGTCAKAISIANTRNVVLRDISVTGYKGPLLSVANVKGKGLEGATEVAPPHTPEPVPAPAVPYKLH